MNEVVRLKYNLAACFSGTGKTSLVRKAQNGVLPFDHRIADVDTGHKAYTDRTRTAANPAWPGNYLDEVKQALQTHDLVLVPQHPIVYERLSHRDGFVLVGPASVHQKAEYLDRFQARGNPQWFIDLFERKFEEFVLRAHVHPAPKILLEPGQYLSDVVGQL